MPDEIEGGKSHAAVQSVQKDTMTMILLLGV